MWSNLQKNFNNVFFYSPSIWILITLWILIKCLLLLLSLPPNPTHKGWNSSAERVNNSRKKKTTGLNPSGAREMWATKERREMKGRALDIIRKPQNSFRLFKRRFDPIYWIEKSSPLFEDVYLIARWRGNRKIYPTRELESGSLFIP